MLTCTSECFLLETKCLTQGDGGNNAGGGGGDVGDGSGVDPAAQDGDSGASKAGETSFDNGYMEFKIGLCVSSSLVHKAQHTRKRDLAPLL